jgi:hypothetical protein
LCDELGPVDGIGSYFGTESVLNGDDVGWPEDGDDVGAKDDGADDDDGDEVGAYDDDSNDNAGADVGLKEDDGCVVEGDIVNPGADVGL